MMSIWHVSILVLKITNGFCTLNDAVEGGALVSKAVLWR